MPSRHRSRRRALQILYQWDLRQEPVEEAIAAYFGPLTVEEGQELPEPDEFTVRLALGTVERVAEIDALIGGHSEHWRLERMPAVDRNLLRLAVYEMNWVRTPAAVVINEALELARRFSGEESVPFINGVLDAVRKKDRQQETGEAAQPGEDGGSESSGPAGS